VSDEDTTPDRSVDEGPVDPEGPTAAESAPATDEAGASAPVETSGNGSDPVASSGTILAFLNEVAGGRGLLRAIRARVDGGADGVALAAPQNQPVAGQIVDRDELRDAAQSRVEVTEAVLAEFGIEAVGAVMDPDPSLALDDAVRAFRPSEVLLSALAESRFGFMRRDLLEWAKERFEVPVTHIPVRIEDDAIRWDVTHTLVVATKTVASPELIAKLKGKSADSPHRYTVISPRSGDLARAEVCDRLARLLAELYRHDIDATGQPMSPEPFAAIQNAIEHYRIDEVLITTLKGEQSKWLEEGLIDDVKGISTVPIEHLEGSDEVSAAAVPDVGTPPVAVGAEQESGEEVDAAGAGTSGGGVAAGGERSD
jgi:hypothetical protein